MIDKEKLLQYLDTQLKQLKYYCMTRFTSVDVYFSQFIMKINTQIAFITMLVENINSGYFDLPAENKGTCRWTPEEDWDGEIIYKTSCNQGQCFTVGDIKDNRYEYCPYCGFPIEEVRDE